MSYPGETLGLPASGPGSLAPMGRRFAALLIDWLTAYGLALLALRIGAISAATLATTVLCVWLLVGLASLRLFGFTPGQLVMGLCVVSVNGRPLGIGRAGLRGLLLGLVIPPLFADSDGRGVHDRLSGTAVVRR